VALVEGVENMQIQYGVDSTGDGVPETYQNANAITNWAEVVTVRITLLLRTIENVRADDYNFASAGVNYSGGFLRKEFVTTIQLRNRGLDI
jgi:type IV pilus assembly protein PilW